MKVIGYMEGTDSVLLTNLMLEGYETIPLANGWDNHGKYIAHVNRTDNIVLVVGYLHKFIPVAKEFTIGDEILSSLRAHKIPLVFIVPKDKQAQANQHLRGRGLKYDFADPSNITGKIMEILKPHKGAGKKNAKSKGKKS